MGSVHSPSWQPPPCVLQASAALSAQPLQTLSTVCKPLLYFMLESVVSWQRCQRISLQLLSIASMPMPSWVTVSKF